MARTIVYTVVSFRANVGVLNHTLSWVLNGTTQYSNISMNNTMTFSPN